MGRYYSGDINGKFMFAVQSSSDADFFGVEGVEPNYLEYNFDESDLDSVNAGIETCEKELGEYGKKIDDFFDRVTGYTDEEIAKDIGKSVDEAKALLTWYARLSLGKEIRDCIVKTGQCNFEAEL